MTSPATMHPSPAPGDHVRLRVGVQGEAGCFSEMALGRLPHPGGDAVYFAEFPAVLDALEAGMIDRALLPFHNTLAGVVGPSLRAMAEHDLRIEREIELPVRLFLLGVPGASLETVASALSHPVALAQCSRFLRHHPAIRAEAVHDTAGAARLVAERGDPGVAAIASREAGIRYGLVSLAPEIQDRTDNATRFWLLARRRLAPDAGRSSLDVAARHLAPRLGLTAVRGATTVSVDRPEEMHEAVAELLEALLSANGIAREEVASAIFTATPDLGSAFPATAARAAGWERVPLLCMAEMAVRNGLPRCIRVLLHVSRPIEPDRVRHVYLREARSLRPDLPAD